MKREKSVRFLILLLLCFLIANCSPRRGGTGGSSGEGIINTILGGVKSEPDREGSSESSNNNNRETNSGNSNNTFCQDNPNTQYCICLNNPDDSRCEDDDREDKTVDESFRERHKELNNRYRTYIDLDSVNENRVEDFLAGQSLNSNLRRSRLYFDLDREVTSQPNTYGGYLQILFEDSDNRDVRSLNRNSLRHSSSENEDVKFNTWFNNFRGNRNRLGYHGFFQDRKFGSMILSIDRVCKWGGESGEFAGDGSIWYMRFKSLVGKNDRNCYRGGSYLGNGGGPSYPNSKQSCWFIGIGPWSCQAWTIGRQEPVVHPNPGDRSVEPTGSCYQKLGTFRHLNIGEAFNLSGDELFLRDVRSFCR